MPYEENRMQDLFNRKLTMDDKLTDYCRGDIESTYRLHQILLEENKTFFQRLLDFLRRLF